MTLKPCVDCLAEHNGDPSLVPSRKQTDKHGKPNPNGRCVTHMRQFTTRQRKAAHANRVKSKYSISGDDYDALKKFQGGHCAICQRGRGVSKNLAVDHDHKCCSGKTSCGSCVRGLLCSPCNSTLAHFRDDPVAVARMFDYLINPPAKQWREAQ